jgi:hypothetical protein
LLTPWLSAWRGLASTAAAAFLSFFEKQPPMVSVLQIRVDVKVLCV